MDFGLDSSTVKADFKPGLAEGGQQQAVGGCGEREVGGIYPLGFLLVGYFKLPFRRGPFYC